MSGDSGIVSSLKQYKLSIFTLAVVTILATISVSSDVSLVKKGELRELMSRDQMRKQARREREILQRQAKFAKKKAALIAEREKKKALKAARKQLYYCMGYPFGGAEEVLKSVEYAVGESMATNYGDEVYDKDFKLKIGEFKPTKLYAPQFKRGPWTNNAELPPPSMKQVLVRTNCGGHCTRVGQRVCASDDEYFEGLTTRKQFKVMCAHGNTYGKHLTRFYGQNSGKPAVLVMRDPMEIVIAQFKDYAENEKFSYTRDALYKYCNTLDKTYSDVPEMTKMRERGYAKPYFDEGGESPPCFSEFYRVLMWYAWAMRMQGKDSHAVIVRWEDINDPVKLDNAVTDILNYMNYTRAHTGTDYPIETPDLGVTFDEEDIATIRAYMGAVSPRPVREIMGSYFE